MVKKNLPDLIHVFICGLDFLPRACACKNQKQTMSHRLLVKWRGEPDARGSVFMSETFLKSVGDTMRQFGELRQGVRRLTPHANHVTTVVSFATNEAASNVLRDFETHRPFWTDQGRWPGFEVERIDFDEVCTRRCALASVQPRHDKNGICSASAIDKIVPHAVCALRSTHALADATLLSPRMLRSRYAPRAIRSRRS